MIANIQQQIAQNKNRIEVFTYIFVSSLNVLENNLSTKQILLSSLLETRTIKLL